MQVNGHSNMKQIRFLGTKLFTLQNKNKVNNITAIFYYTLLINIKNCTKFLLRYSKFLSTL